MRNQANFFRRGGWLRRGALLGALAMPLAACEPEAILEVEDPDIVQPDALVGELGVSTFFAGSILDFAIAYSGAGGSAEGVVLAGGLLADEYAHSGTFPTRIQFDRRRIDEDNVTLRNLFLNLQRARVSTARAATLLAEADASDERVSQAWALNGYTFVFFAENFCSGVPFSEAPPAGEFQFGEALTTREILQEAIESFELALNDPAAAEDTRNLALVGKARALLDLGDFQQAAAVAEQVPTGFLAVVEHSLNSSRQENAVYVLNALSERWSMANDEGGSGRPFLESATNDGEGLSFLAEFDPRVPFELDPDNGLGFDGLTPNYELLGYPHFGIDLDRGAPQPLAFGIEARLIEAEAQLQAGDIDGAFEILNNLRTEDFPDLGLEPLPVPESFELAVDVLFHERAFWMYATAHRLGDLRRLVRQYGRPANAVYPEGEYFKGGVYGEDLNFPVPVEEGNNPLFTGCIDRSA